MHLGREREAEQQQRRQRHRDRAWSRVNGIAQRRPHLAAHQRHQALPAHARAPSAAAGGETRRPSPAARPARAAPPCAVSASSSAASAGGVERVDRAARRRRRRRCQVKPAARSAGSAAASAAAGHATSNAVAVGVAPAQLLGRRVGDQAAGVDERRPVAVVDFLEEVRRDEHGDAGGRLLLDAAPRTGAVVHVDAGRRLVEEQHARPMQRRHRQAGALADAGGEVLRLLALGVAEREALAQRRPSGARARRRRGRRGRRRTRRSRAATGPGRG